jgi:biotin carboxylase
MTQQSVNSVPANWASLRAQQELVGGAMPHILFVESNRSGYGAEYFHVAKTLGYEVTMASFNPDYFVPPGKSIADTNLKYVDRFIVSDTHDDISKLDNEVCALHLSRPIHGIVATGDLEVVTAAILAEKLGLRTSPSSGVRAARNKRATRLALTAAGVPQPKYQIVSNRDDIASAADALGAPFIIKPVDGTDSMNVRLCSTASEAEAVFCKHFSEPRYRRGYPKDTHMLMEEHITGPLYSVEIVLTPDQVHILGVTDRMLSPLPFFVEMWAGFPSYNAFNDSLVATALSAARALKLTHGPLHI